MRNIVPGIASLVQHLEAMQIKSELYRPPCCSECGRAGVWRHGCYERKSGRGAEHHLNPISIPRFLCPKCHKTLSTLPECIPPHRWYLWCIQQLVLLHCLAGLSLHKISHQTQLGRSTVRRWWQRFCEQFLLHRDALSNAIHELGTHNDIMSFWHACLRHLSLAQAMRHCHCSGVVIP